MSACRVKIVIGTLSALLLPQLASATDAPLLHPIFQDHAVLQRDAPIRLWGDAAPGTRVTVQLESTQVQARADRQGHWEARLPAHAAGGPYSLKASAANGAMQQIDDVLIGDVWLCSGQSNMELQVHRTLDSRSEIADADHPSIRMFKVPAQSSPTPQRGLGGTATWQRTTPETVKDFSAACYYFARELQKKIDVPMGLINASWGGSQLQAWIGDKALRAAGDDGPALDVLARLQPTRSRPHRVGPRCGNAGGVPMAKANRGSRMRPATGRARRRPWAHGTTGACRNWSASTAWSGTAPASN